MLLECFDLSIFSQVSFTKSMHTQSFTIEVCVIDKNDNVPVFLEESMRGSVQLGLLKGGWGGAQQACARELPLLDAYPNCLDFFLNSAGVHYSMR